MDIRRLSEEEKNLAAMLKKAGYSEKAAWYYIKKPYIGAIEDADQVSEMTGTCGDTLKIFLKTDGSIIEDIRYEVYGCAGSMSAAMASVDLVRGKSLKRARELEDSDIFAELEEIPVEKHHCIQLAVKTLHLAVDEYLARKERSLK